MARVDELARSDLISRSNPSATNALTIPIATATSEIGSTRSEVVKSPTCADGPCGRTRSIRSDQPEQPERHERADDPDRHRDERDRQHAQRSREVTDVRRWPVWTNSLDPI